MRFRAALLLVALPLLLASFHGCSAGGSATGLGGWSGGGYFPGGGGSTQTFSMNGGGSGQSTRGIGAACTSDTDCGGSPWQCLTDDADDPVFGGGPAGGFCTIACSRDSECRQSNTVCFQPSKDQTGRCVPTCTIGPGLDDLHLSVLLSSQLSSEKCLGRPELSCTKKSDYSVCLPSCGVDSQCPSGRVCDPKLNVCVKNRSPGLPAGSVCDRNQDPTPCAGTCMTVATGAMCTETCVLGADSLIGDAGRWVNCGSPEEGFCGFHGLDAGLGDLGYCAPACLSHSDCQTPNFWCYRFEPLSTVSGKGYCFTAVSCNEGGQADCDTAAGLLRPPCDAGSCADAGVSLICTSMPDAGRFCRDTTYDDAGVNGDAGVPPADGSSPSGPPDAEPSDGGLDAD